jgi:hypothetical protein
VSCSGLCDAEGECAVTDGHEESRFVRRELVIPRDLQTNRTVTKEIINCNSK